MKRKGEEGKRERQKGDQWRCRERENEEDRER